ncbi:hypothetical protein ElyMa_004664700, partial [Elysia marginata]
TFVHYVGNRLHVIFHSAGVLYTYHAKLISFTENECTGGGLLRANILRDLKNDNGAGVGTWDRRKACLGTLDDKVLFLQDVQSFNGVAYLPVYKELRSVN